MADLSTVLFTALLIFLSYLFWKWYSSRHTQHKEPEKPHRADIIKNRLKKFDNPLGKNPSTKLTDDGHNKSGDSRDGEGILEDKKDIIPARSTHSHQSVRFSLTDEELIQEPVIRPLRKLEELFTWREGYDEFNVASTPLMRDTDGLEQRPRTIVCHDMKGGYLEDRFSQGCSSSDCYRIYHWQYIDVFIYFSHNMVTIPPPCWTNAAHKHGVVVLGTFITEWEDGAMQCAKIFHDKNSYQTIADQLVLLAKYYGFDGWLLNIENPIQPAQMKNVVEFVKYLTDEMHKQSTSSLIIWYDSVTYKGELKWQNQLNDENSVFFNMSDGIFLNYGWNEKCLTSSVQAARENRRYDVYVGVDVFGRGVFGGGGWNSNKATHLIKEKLLSTALFAPGWVYEKYKSNFKINQDNFWASVAADLNTHSIGSRLPFVTSFCQGYGDKFFSYGKIVLHHSWSHLSAQQLQPTFINQVYSLGQADGVSVTSVDHQTDTAYHGGGCLSLEGSTKMTNQPSKAIVRLFKTNMKLPRTTMISVTMNVEGNDSLLVALQLHIDTKPNYIMLCPMSKDSAVDEQDCQEMDTVDKRLVERYGVPRSGKADKRCMSLPTVGEEHYRLFSPLHEDYHTKMMEICCDHKDADSSPWFTRYYLLAEENLKGSTVKEIRLVLTNNTISDSSTENERASFKLHIGEIKIINAVSLRQPLPSIYGLKCLESEIKCHIIDENTQATTLTLSWNYDNSLNIERWERFQIYHLQDGDKNVLLGYAYCLYYVVCNLHIPRTQSEIKFCVQAVSVCQRKAKLEDCPTIIVKWS